jgi:hypothetical protein
MNGSYNEISDDGSRGGGNCDGGSENNSNSNGGSSSGNDNSKVATKMGVVTTKKWIRTN